jgi:hypothetical protein
LKRDHYNREIYELTQGASLGWVQWQCIDRRSVRLKTLVILLTSLPAMKMKNPVCSRKMTDHDALTNTLNPNPTKTHGILPLSEGGETGSRGHVSIQVA